MQDTVNNFEIQMREEFAGQNFEFFLLNDPDGTDFTAQVLIKYFQNLLETHWTEL